MKTGQWSLTRSGDGTLWNFFICINEKSGCFHSVSFRTSKKKDAFKRAVALAAGQGYTINPSNEEPPPRNKSLVIRSWVGMGVKK